MELNYKSFGQGDPLIIMHGMFGTLDNWQTLGKQFAKDYMVFIIDLRNHGKSPHSDEFSYSIMAEDIKNFMETNWIYEAHIIGHSMGGKVAMEFACEYEDMVDKLIIADIAPKAYKGNHENIFKALFSLNLETLTSRKEADQILQQRIPEFGVRQFILKNLHIDKSTGKYKWKMNLEVIHNAYAHILDQSLSPTAQYDGDCLFIGGGNSAYINLEEKATYQNFFPNAEFKMIEDAGHWLHAEKPKEFYTIVKEYLQA